MRHILITAYDVNPYKGSESATGWNFIWQISRDNKVTAITRKNNKNDIEKYIDENKVEVKNLKFAYFDLPYYLRFWKRGARGALLYYYLWQISLPFALWKKRRNFDIVHGLNFHNDWTPSFLWLLNKNFVWGPVNHNEPVLLSYSLRSFGILGSIKEMVKVLIKIIFWKLDPFLFICKKKAKYIFCGNSSVARRLGFKTKNQKIIMLSQVGISTSIANKMHSESEFNIMTAGRMIEIKSFDIVLKAFSRFIHSVESGGKKIKLTIVGDGRLFDKMKCLSEKLGVSSSVEFKGWISKDDIDSVYESSDLFVFTSHEGAGLVVAEAMSHGLPIICFDNYGPGETVTSESGIKVPYTNYEKSVVEISNALMKLYCDEELLFNLSKGAIEASGKFFWQKKAKLIERVYSEL